MRHVLRVVQEALTNAMKHARATRLEVDVRDDDEAGMLRVDVTDDGVGVAASARAVASGEGRGLDNMRQRARGLRGELEVLADAPRGTRVRLSIPSASRSAAAADFP